MSLERHMCSWPEPLSKVFIPVKLKQAATNKSAQKAESMVFFGSPRSTVLRF